MSWSASGTVDAGSNSSTFSSTPPEDGMTEPVKAQFRKAKEFAEEIADYLGGDECWATLSGHVHAESDALSSLNVSVGVRESQT